MLAGGEIKPLIRGLRTAYYHYLFRLSFMFFLLSTGAVMSEFLKSFKCMRLTAKIRCSKMLIVLQPESSLLMRGECKNDFYRNIVVLKKEFNL